MDGTRWKGLKASFDELAELAPTERRARLRRLQARDPDLAVRLERLLDADADVDRRLGLLEAPAGGPDFAPVPAGAPGAAAVAASPDPFQLTGSTVAHFRIDDVIGVGGMGVVYRGRDLRLGRPVALKFLLPNFALDPLARRRFLHEARTASALDHPGICTILEAGESERGQLFIAMRCYAGETLRCRLAREGSIRPAEALDLTRQLLAALTAAHQAGLVHRDLKPGNLMLTPDGALKILDFGVVKARDLSLTGSQGRPGTVAYMSPEQLRSDTVDARSDLWSVGVVLFEMLTGRTPFGGGHELSTIYRILHENAEPPSTLRPGLPTPLDALVLRLLSKDVADRIASAVQALEELSVVSAQIEALPDAGDSRPADAASAGRSPSALPVPATALIGRGAEMERLCRWLRQGDVRLLCLTGPAGTGKTRLALAVAAAVANEFADGVCFVDLAPVAEPAHVTAAITHALDLRDRSGHEGAGSLVDRLRRLDTLLLLDNFEHLAAAAPAIAEILAASPRVRLLVTSRVPLRIAGEQEFEVPPLTLPELRQAHLPEQVAGAPAVRLLVERAQRVRPGFAPTAENAVAIAEICHRLDGLPLAIELAAARLRILGPAEMLERLSSRLGLLTGGSRDAPARHRTLAAAIEWSYGLLDEADQRLFARLGVFAGAASLDAVEPVCGEPGASIVDGVGSLVGQSLLRRDRDLDGEPRFSMLETIREYALGRLDRAGEADSVRRRHAEFYRTLAEQADSRFAGPEQGPWQARVVAEHDNFRAALRWALDQGEPGLAAGITAGLWKYWYLQGRFTEGRRWLNEVLAAEGLDTGARAFTLQAAGALATQQDDLVDAARSLEEALALYRRLGDPLGIGRTLNNLGLLAQRRADPAAAVGYYEAALSIYREHDKPQCAAIVRRNLGGIAHEQRNFALAEAMVGEDLAQARDLGDSAEIGAALRNLGMLAIDQADYPRAGQLLRHSLAHSRDGGDARGSALTLAWLARFSAVCGDADNAARLGGAAEACLAHQEMRLPPDARAEHDRCLAAARQQADPAGWERAWAEGVEMTLDEAVAVALRCDPPERGA